jgi:hypothetical protein
MNIRLGRRTPLKNLLSFTLKVLTWVNLTFTLGLPGYERKLDALICSLVKVEMTRGTASAVTYIKNIRTAVLHFLSGEYPNKRVDGVALTPDGLPRVLGPLIQDLRLKESPTYVNKVRILLTLLYASRALNLGKTPDIDSIIMPAKAVPQGGNQNYRKHLKAFWAELGYTRRGSVPRSLNWKLFHFSTKSGPNGHALYTSMNDLWNIPEKDLSHIFTIGGAKLRKTIEDLVWLRDKLHPMFCSKGTTRRKLAYFPDKELKVRVIAIGDYWSQTALIPLHKYLFRVLKKIPQDCTFAQSSFITKIKDWKEFHSIDLTAATDRFPIWFEKMVLNGVLPYEYCQAWEQVMVATPFSYKAPDGTSKEVKYAVGNPMGFYSSWNSFAVAHHYLMYYCGRELGIPFNELKYVILGDDVLIGDSRLSHKYKQVIRDLGVEFSELKTHTSCELAEFAKRLVWRGSEITPFPISSLKESRKRFYLLVNLFCEQMERGWTPLKGIPGTVFDFYRIVSMKSSTFCAKLRDRSFTCELIMRMMRGTISASDTFNSIIRKFDLPLPDQTEQDSKEFLNGFFYEAFIRSDPQFSENTEPLGALAESLVCQITGIDDVEDFDRLFSIPSKIPILACYGQIEEAWLKLRKEADGLFTRTLSEWTIIKPMTIPLSDKVFVERQSHLVARASAILGDKLLPALRALARPAFSVYFPE